MYIKLGEIIPAKYGPLEEDKTLELESMYEVCTSNYAWFVGHGFIREARQSLLWSHYIEAELAYRRPYGEDY